VLIDQTLHYGGPTNIIGRIIENGTDDKFARFKHRVQADQPFRDICLRLNGVTEMIEDLANQPDGSQVRTYLSEIIRRQVESAIGGDVPWTGLRSSDECIRFTSSWAQRDICDILGIVVPGLRGREAATTATMGTGGHESEADLDEKRQSSPSASSVTSYMSEPTAPLGASGRMGWE
jgi:hypothetical protein